MSDHRSHWSNILSLEVTKSLKRPGKECEVQMTSTKSLLSFQLFAHQGLSEPEVTASSSPQSCCWLLTTYTQACPGLLRHPVPPAQLRQCPSSWALRCPHPNTSVIHIYKSSLWFGSFGTTRPLVPRHESYAPCWWWW